MSQAELTESEVLTHLSEWHAWVARNGKEPVPSFLRTLHSKTPTLFRMLGGFTLHGLLSLLYRLANRLKMYRLAARVARFRIATDHLSFEPMQCGLNTAYCRLGIAYLKLDRTSESVSCLEKAWRVYPCPHNTSYGLKMRLLNLLSLCAEAKDSVTRYKQMSKAFVAQQTAPEDALKKRASER